MKKSIRCASLAILLASISVIAAGVLRAEPPPGVQQGGGVVVDFLALGMNGQAVPDLKPADVSIKVGGRQRTVASLEFVKTDSPGAGTAAPAAALPAPFAVNSGGSGTGRNLLILIDNESLRTGTERAIRESLDQVLSQFGPNDRVAFSVAPRDTVNLGFGAGLPAVRAAVAKFAGIRPANPGATEEACRTRDTLVLLRNMMDALAGSEAPTSVLFIASSLSLQGNIGANTGNLRCEVLTEHYSGIASAVANGRVNLYVAQGDDTSSQRDNGLENLAGVGSAGGVVRAIPGGLTRILAENSGYYLATLQPESSDKPGSTAKLEVKVAREGVATRARADVMLGARGNRAVAKAMTPREMIATTAPFNDLQLRSVAVVSRGAEGKMNVTTLTEPVEAGVKLAAVSAVIIAPGADKAAFARTATEKELAGRMVVLGLAADPGKYRVRVAATDAKGRAGAVDVEVDATLVSAGPLQIGQMLLLAPRGDGFAPQMIFTDEAEAAVVFDLFGPLTTSKVGLKVDIAATMDGPTLVEGVLGYAPTSEPDRFTINAKLPIGKLAPGDYVVRAVAQVEGQPEGKVTRTLRKVAK